MTTQLLHLSTLYEEIADAIPAAPALRRGQVLRNWREFDERASKLAGGLREAGIGPDSKVAIYLYNCNEWLEAVHASLKIRAVPVNVNYRYLDDELVYLLDNSDSETVIFHAAFTERIERIRSRLPQIKCWISVADGSEFPPADPVDDYERLIAECQPAERIERDPEDTLFVYTGDNGPP